MVKACGESCRKPGRYSIRCWYSRYITRNRPNNDKPFNDEYALGKCYENGIGVAVDLVEAARWYRLADDKGDPRAEDHLVIIKEKLKAKSQPVSGVQSKPSVCTITLNLISLCHHSAEPSGITIHSIVASVLTVKRPLECP